MTDWPFFSTFFGILVLIAAIWLATSRDLFRLVIAFSLQLVACAGLVMTLERGNGEDLLAIILGALAFFGGGVLLYFGNNTSRRLAEYFKEPQKIGHLFAGILVTACFSGGLYWVLPQNGVVSTPLRIGEFLLQGNLFLLLVFSPLLLMAMVGCAMLLRENKE